MNPAFDPYHLWLGIPPEDQPPNHYRLLGLQVRESDEEVIDIAALRLSAHVRGFLNGPHGEAAKRLLMELAAASGCLLDPERKAAYDATLPAPPFTARKQQSWPETEMPGAALPVIVPLAMNKSPAERQGGSTTSRQTGDRGIFQFVKIIGGGVAGLALGDLVIYLLTGNDMLGVLPSRPKAVAPSQPVAVVASARPAAPRIESERESPHPPRPVESEQPVMPAPAQPEPAPISLVPPPTAPPPVTTPATRPQQPVRDQTDVLGSVAAAWRLPEILSLDPKVVATLAREPDEPLVLTLRCDAARLAAGTTFYLDPQPDGRSWTIQHVNEAKSPATRTALGMIRRRAAALSFAWLTLAESETRGQVLNCLLEVRHGSSTREVQLREVHQAGPLALDMSDDKQVVEFALPDVPKLDKLRIEIRELVGFPSDAELPVEAKSLLMGKQAFLQFSRNSGGGIRVRFPYTSASAPSVLMRTEAVFRESARVEFDLSFPAVDKFVTSIERELQKDQATLSNAQRTLTLAQSELQRQQASRPTSSAETAAKQLAMRNAKSAISSATNRIGSLTEQIALNQKRQAAVPTIRALLDSLHLRAAIRYVVLAECGERDLMLVDGTGATASAD